MAFEVLRTPQARRTVEREMDGTARALYEAARDELRGRGCLAGGHRMAAADGDDYPLCRRHLANDWRMYTTYPDEKTVVIVAIDRHTKSHDPAVVLADTSEVYRTARDEYARIEELLKTNPIADLLVSRLSDDVTVEAFGFEQFADCRRVATRRRPVPRKTTSKL